MDLASVDPRTNKRTTSVVSEQLLTPAHALRQHCLTVVQAYLEQAGARPNLKILVNAPVARILSAPGSGFVASGVEFLYDGQKHTVSTTADGEVILSAGFVTLLRSYVII